MFLVKHGEFEMTKKLRADIESLESMKNKKMNFRKFLNVDQSLDKDDY